MITFILSVFIQSTLLPLCGKASDPKAPKDNRGKVLRGISRDGEFRNWAASVRTAPAKVLRPKTIKDVQDYLMQVSFLGDRRCFDNICSCSVVRGSLGILIKENLSIAP